jgi:uncharacterized protein (DUF58 family)
MINKFGRRNIKSFLKPKNRIYIVPTYFGGLYLFAAFSMLLLGSSFQNNLINLLGYFMLSLVIVAMVETNSNLKNLKVSRLTIEPAAENTNATFDIVIENSSLKPKSDLMIQPKLKGEKIPRREERNFDATVAANQNTVLRGKMQMKERGVRFTQFVHISSTFPLGLFYSWMHAENVSEVIVYPTPIASIPLPKAESTTQVQMASLKSLDAGDFRGHHHYITGESQKKIDWRAYARRGVLLSKEFDGDESDLYQIDWRQTLSLKSDMRLGQLTRWTLDCARQKYTFSLATENSKIELGNSKLHLHKCLKALAMTETASESRSRHLPNDNGARRDIIQKTPDVASTRTQPPSNPAPAVKL